ncbi:MAG: DUF3108 domain-containing protein [Candidatus Solibacter sp.]|jgi:hypothetical protein
MVCKLLLPLVCATLAFSQSSGLPAKETLYYSIDWRLFTAGKARIELTAGQPRPGYQATLHMESTGIVSKLFKVEDDYSANMDSAWCAQTLQMTTHEGNRLRETTIAFDGEAKKASYLERDRARNNAIVLSRETEIPPCVHDVIGGLFFVRTLNLEPGQSTQVPVSDGKKSVMVKVEAQAREDVKTPDGTFKTIRYEAYLFDGVLYKRSAHVNLWVSDDRRKLPVQIRVRMTFTIGTINLQLEKHE